MTEHSLEPTGNALRDQMRMANAFSTSDLVPDTFKGKPANVLLVMMWADNVGLDYFSALQGTYVLHGKVCQDAVTKIGLANKRGPFEGPIRYETTGKGESMAVTAYGMIGEDRHERTVSMATAKAEGWTRNAKYKTIPEQMLTYRAATFLIRAYCPEVVSSTQTPDEIVDVYGAPRHVRADVLPVAGPAAELNEQLLSVAPAPAKRPTAAVADDGDQELLRAKIEATYASDADPVANVDLFAQGGSDEA